jgi:hypothetical protein
MSRQSVQEDSTVPVPTAGSHIGPQTFQSPILSESPSHVTSIITYNGLPSGSSIPPPSAKTGATASSNKSANANPTINIPFIFFMSSFPFRLSYRPSTSGITASLVCFLCLLENLSPPFGKRSVAIFELSLGQLESHLVPCLGDTGAAAKTTSDLGKVQRSHKSLIEIYNCTPRTSTPKNKIAKPTLTVGFAIDSAEPKRPPTGSASSSPRIKSQANLSPSSNILAHISHLSIHLS